MKKIIVNIILLTALTVIACTEKPKVESQEDKYIAEINRYRAEKNSAFKISEKSPIPEDERNKFEGLKYYPPDSKYYVEAKFVKYDNPDTLKIFTTKPDDIRTMLRYGEFRFEIGGKKYALQGYVNLPLGSPLYVFLPFTDLTTGKESYEGGRYLDIDLDENADTVVLDFNMAYNPYCAYNSRYSCPLVPTENFLNAEIKAGEKKYKEH